mgnify:CR=1 FL=1
MSHPTLGDLHTLAEEVGGVLVERQETVATAESCTAGLVSATLTGVPGSSDFFWGGTVVYGADAKIELAGLDPELLKEHGTVSATTTEALAETIRDRSRATYGVAVTGLAGPTAGPGEVGRVFGAVADQHGVVSRRWHFDGDRGAVRAAAVGAVLDLLRQRLAGSDDGADD